MNVDEVLRLQHISKRYYLYRRPSERLKQMLLSPLTRKEYAHALWALQDINISVYKGETLGVIGVNGSGKSTLLQIMAGTLMPTTGSIERRGRLTALLELGAGFHPEFTGRENVYLSGATLGISEAEMRRRFDEIVDFAGIGEFIDQPVKLYSSGMYVRLAFSIATCVDPDILIVDEALAVGDAGFIIKCMDRMRKLQQQGTAIVLVTHDVQTVRSLCDRVLWLSHGKMKMIGAPMEVTSQYVQMLWKAQTQQSNPTLSSNTKVPDEKGWIPLDSGSDLIRWGNGGMRIEAIRIETPRGYQPVLFLGEPITISLRVRALQEVSDHFNSAGINLRNMRGLNIITFTTLDEGVKFPVLHTGQKAIISFQFDNVLAPGDYMLVAHLENRKAATPEYDDYIENAISIKVISDKSVFSLVLPRVKTSVQVEH